MMMKELDSRVIGDYAIVRGIELPHGVEAVTLPNDDYTFNVYVNTALPKEVQIAALAHELNHIELNHFWSCADIQILETMANIVNL